MADDQIGVGLMGWLRDVKARVVEIDNDGGAKFKGGVGFNGTAPVGQATAYTQTFSSAGRTVVAPSGGAIATGSAAVVAPGSAAFGLAEADMNGVVTTINALVADMLGVKQQVSSLIDDLQALGLVG